MRDIGDWQFVPLARLPTIPLPLFVALDSTYNGVVNMDSDKTNNCAFWFHHYGGGRIRRTVDTLGRNLCRYQSQQGNCDRIIRMKSRIEGKPQTWISTEKVMRR